MKWRTKFTQPTRRHRIAKGRALAVMNTVEPVESLREDGTRVRTWVGMDDRGLELEVVGLVITDDQGPLMLVIHVMPRSFRK